MPCIATSAVPAPSSRIAGAAAFSVLPYELGGSSKSWCDVIPLLAIDHRVIAAGYAGRRPL
jgi:hypothetical protein